MTNTKPWPYKGLTCRGCYAFGTACGRCEKCKDDPCNPANMKHVSERAKIPESLPNTKPRIELGGIVLNPTFTENKESPRREREVLDGYNLTTSAGELITWLPAEQAQMLIQALTPTPPASAVECAAAVMIAEIRAEGSGAAIIDQHTKAECARKDAQVEELTAALREAEKALQCTVMLRDEVKAFDNRTSVLRAFRDAAFHAREALTTIRAKLPTTNQNEGEVR